MAQYQLVASLLGLAGIASIVACQPVPPPKTGATSLAIPSIEDCDAAGGTVQRVGMMGTETCVVPLADAGKSCSGSSDCIGRCIVTEWGEAEIPEAGAKVQGTCQATNVLFGCFTEIEGGKAQVALCVD